jgi:hypothetical protein
MVDLNNGKRRPVMITWQQVVFCGIAMVCATVMMLVDSGLKEFGLMLLGAAASAGVGAFRRGPMVLIIGLALATFATSSCHQNWKKTTLQTLASVQRFGEGVHAVAQQACRPVLEKCKADRTNPCPALLKCQAIRRPVLKALDSLHRAVLLGYIAVDAGKETSATAMLGRALEAAKIIQDGLKNWGVKLE